MPRRIPKERQDALLVWVRKMLAEGKQKAGPERMDQLYDGAFFSDLLEILDDEYNPSELQENLSNPRPDRRNLHLINKALRSFVSRELPDVEVLINEIRFQDLEREPQNDGMAAILEIMLIMSVNLENNVLSRHVLANMGKSPNNTPQSMETLSHLSPIITNAAARIDRAREASTKAHEGGDDALAKEAEIATLRKELHAARTRTADITTQHDHLREGWEDLKDKNEELQRQKDELDAVVQDKLSGSEPRLKQELKEARETIDNLEEEINLTKDASSRVQDLAAQLKVANEKIKDLIDEKQELAHMNEGLTKKANAAAHLKQKLDKLKDLEKEVKDLRQQRNDLYEASEKFGAAQKALAQARVEADFRMEQMSKYEMEIAENYEAKSSLKLEIERLERHVESMEMRAKNDEEMIRDLQEKGMITSDPGTPSVPAHQSLSLEDELRGTSNDISVKDIEVSRLQAENALLKSSIGTETEKGQLLQEIEKARSAQRAQQQKYNELFEKYTLENQSLNALIDDKNGNGENAVTKFKTQIQAEEARSKQLAKQLDAVQAELEDRQREVLEARGDINAMAKGSQDALAELKKTDQLVSGSLEVSLQNWRGKHEALKEELESRQNMLIAALVDKDQLRKQLEDAGAELQKAAAGQAVNPDVTKTTEKMEKLRDRYKKLSEQLEKSEQSRHELEKMVKTLRAGASESAQKSQQEQVIKNLQRENAMISSAWYDLTSRLQSNHVVLQRRSDAPKSWLNKQRQMVNATPRR